MSSLENLAEFVKNYKACKGDDEKRTEMQKKAFNFIDKDQAGFIDKAEIAQFFRKLVELVLQQMGAPTEGELPDDVQAEIEAQITAETDALMGLLDHDENGNVSFEEFKKGADKLAELASKGDDQE